METQRNQSTGRTAYTIFLRQILDKLTPSMLYLRPVCNYRNDNYWPDIMRYLLLLLFFAAFILTSTCVRAEIYTYIDENGTIHFTNVPTDPQYKMIIPPKAERTKVNEGDIKKDFGKLIETKSYKYGLDPALVRAVISVESDFNPRAISEKGARGLMQLMPMTADELGVINPFDPETNIDGGVRYLKYLLDYFNWDIDKALAAYHAGISRVIEHTGIPPIPATHHYVKKVKNQYSKYILQ